MSAYLIVANFPNVGEQIWYGYVEDDISFLKSSWKSYVESYYDSAQNELPVPLQIIHVDANGKTEILPWEDS